MKNAFVTLFTLAASAGFAAAQFMVNTPTTPIECVPTLIQWQNGQSPFTLLIQEPDANGTPVQVYTGITGQSFSWPTNITSGTSIGITVRDATGQSAQSAPVIIQAGGSDSCIGAGGSSAPAATDSTTSGAPSGSSVPAGTSSGPSTSVTTPAGSSIGSTSSTGPRSTSSAPSGASTSSGASPSPTGGSNNNNGAMGNTAALGAVGIIAAAVAAVMA